VARVLRTTLVGFKMEWPRTTLDLTKVKVK
jgi:hypothetical protein